MLSPDPNGTYLMDIVLILKSQWPRKHTENTEYSQLISVSSVDSVDSVAIYHDFDLTKCNSVLTPDSHGNTRRGFPFASKYGDVRVWHSVRP